MWTTTDAAVIQKIKDGTVSLNDLAGATQLGLAAGDLLNDCATTGNGCTDVYAVSIPGVKPARFITWFQAAAAARNAGKRLPTNAEWQAAALGTPDEADDNLDTCNTTSDGIVGNDPVDTGSRMKCSSNVGAFDMVGNLWEWAADWVPRSTGCVTALFAGDLNCLAGADNSGTGTGPGALVRGGSFNFGTGAGVFAVVGGVTPAQEFDNFGFRAAR
ncbi:MAG: SUMF1/EgtB/PvdO family nonheme iron enzyme [Candidatus Methylomirabilales bacterium]